MNFPTVFAASHDTHALALIDRSFLATKQQIFIPQHALTLSPALMCVFLYGVYGPASEDHLLRLLEQGNENAKIILEILAWIGTDKSIPLAKKFDTFPGEKTLPPDTVKQRLAGMYENYGQDTRTNPAAILNADLSGDYLITELAKIRSHMFHRISDEALEDVRISNFLIYALLFWQQ